jgi:PAS domain S-box-containing protein
MKAVSKPGARVSRPLHVLIVDDSKADAELLLRTLLAGGFEASHQLVDTQAAMRTAIEGQEWDVITSDHSMPQFTGPAALALAKEICPQVPFIVVSGEIDLNLAVSLIKEGAQDYVRKDEMVRLVPVIERVLHDVEARREQRAAEQALQLSEMRYRRLFETAKDGILIVNAETGQIDDVNPFLLNLVGFSRENYLGKKMWQVAVFNDEEASKAAFRELQKTGYIRYEDIPVRTSAGGCVDVEFVSNVYLVGPKRVIQCNIRDIRGRKRAEGEIRGLNADLEGRVQARTAQVEALNKAAESFNYSVSHDLRAPLRRITGFVKALEEDCSATLDAAGKRLIENILASTQHMTSLIEARLKLASLSSGELQRKTTSLSSLVHVVANELQESDPGRHVEFVIAEGITAACDANLLRIVIENLLANAWKFTSQLAVARIEFGVTHETDKPAAYFVRDNGAGFDMQFAAKLFGVFQRLHAESEFPGTGIGLASVQRIVHRHGGQIWAESTVGQGATFYFVLEADPKDGTASVASVLEPLLSLTSAS